MTAVDLTNGYLERLPSRAEIDARLCANARERRLLERLLRIASERDAVLEAVDDVQRTTPEDFQERPMGTDTPARACPMTGKGLGK